MRETGWFTRQRMGMNEFVSVRSCIRIYGYEFVSSCLCVVYFRESDVAVSQRRSLDVGASFLPEIYVLYYLPLPLPRNRQERQRPIVDFGVWRPGGRSRRAEFEARAPLEPCPTQGSGLATSTNAWHPFRAADAAGWRLAHASTAR